MTVYDSNITGSGIIENMTDAEAEAALELELSTLARGVVGEAQSR